MNWVCCDRFRSTCRTRYVLYVFYGCSTAYGGEPNTQCCPVCIGMPGTLPVLNEKVLEYAFKAGLALNCEITRYNVFNFVMHLDEKTPHLHIDYVPVVDGYTKLLVVCRNKLMNSRPRRILKNVITIPAYS